MSKYILFLVICGLLAPVARLDAQVVAHTTWKAYFLVISDSVTLRFTADSMTVRSDSGHVLLQSGFKDSGKIVTVDDYGGLCACPDYPGKYQAKITGDTLIMIPTNESCDIRNSTLMAKRWIRVAAPQAPVSPAAKKKRRG
jgi:hypothetical protein